MKNKFPKAVCFFSSIAAILFLSSFNTAYDTPHVHSESCVYHCELDAITTTDSFEPYHKHIDHAGSESCKYSCPNPANNNVSSYRVYTQDEIETFLEAYQNASTEEVQNALIAEHFGIPLSAMSST